MPGAKRPLVVEDAVDEDHLHPSRKKRVKHTEANVQLAKIYNDLADEVESVRLQAANALVQSTVVDPVGRKDRVDAALTRLIRGLCSGRNAARAGFSLALTETLRIANGSGYDLRTVSARVIEATQPEGKASGQERRDYLLGRCFALNAILNSNFASSSKADDEDWLSFFSEFVNLASQKPWLRKECGHMLYKWLATDEVSTILIQCLIDAMSQKSIWKTPEGVALWLITSEHHSTVKLPKDVWHHRDPLSSKERSSLSKAMRESSNDADQGKEVAKSGARQSVPNFAWTVVLSTLYKRDDSGKAFPRFWKDTIDEGMFSTTSSTERKATGLQIAALAIRTAPVDLLNNMLKGNLLRYILDQRSDPERKYLFEAAKVPLTAMNFRAKNESRAAVLIVHALLNGAGVRFDQITKTKTVETLLSYLGDEKVEIVHMLRRKVIEAPDDVKSVCGTVDFLLAMVRNASNTNGDQNGSETRGIAKWVKILLHTLGELSYGQLPQASRTAVRARFMSSVGHILGLGGQAPQAVSSIVVHLAQPESAADHEEPILRAKSIVNQLDDAEPALQTLLSISVLQVYNEEPDGVAVLRDLISFYDTRQSERSNESSSLLIELLLSFVSKPSALFRKMAEQVFTAFAADLTAEGLQSMLSILQQSESMSGQQALFEQNGSDVDESEGSDADAIDVEDESDIELVNGEAAGSSTSSQSDDSDDDEESNQADSAAESPEENEEAAFDRKLAAALGTAAADQDDADDSDGSDMDDDQMMALEPHLTSIFKERQKVASKKQDNKEAKQNIVNFKNRVLDLLSIYVKSQYADLLALDIVLPLVTLVRTTSSKEVGEKAFAVLKQYFEACNRNKSFPRLSDAEPCFEVLGELHNEMKKAGSKMHTAACSRSSLFLARVLTSMDVTHFDRVQDMYGSLFKAKFQDSGCQIQGSVFTDWTSWVIAPRKNT